MNTKKRNKIAGAIYGFVIGDAMGATTEFMSDKQIMQMFGKVTDIIGGGWLNLKAGDVTDDTQMSICVIDAFMKSYEEKNNKTFVKNCADNFVEWYKSGPKDVGGQCARGIRYYMQTGQYIYKDRNAMGNGSLMRAMPCAVLNEPFLNIEQGRITHNNQDCSQVILDYTRMIQNYLDGILYSYNIKGPQEPSGYLWNTFNNAVYWSNGISFEDAIINAVNHGGDADTIAAITGSLAGAKFGFDEIPQRWIDQLDDNVKITLEKFKNFAFTYLQV